MTYRIATVLQRLLRSKADDSVTVAQRPQTKISYRYGWLGVLALGFGLTFSGAAQAANRINLRVGPLRQTIYVDDLETFSRTGELPSHLRLYRTVLTPEVRLALSNRLALDPAISERMIDDVLASPNGELLLNTLAKVAPNMTLEQLQTAVQLASQQANGLNVLAILRAIPQETLDIDVAAALSLVSQLNLARLEGQALSQVLEQSLWVPDTAPIANTLDPTLRGPLGVEKRTFIFNDRDRQRSIPLDIYWGGRRRPGPLIVVSHGFGADRQFLAYMAEHLASYGFTVVSIEHPGSNVEALSQLPLDPETLEQPSQILPPSEFLDRPRDVSYVLDRLAWMNRNSGLFRNRFNTDQVVFIGHSLGGYTGLALAGATLDLRGLRPFCAHLNPIGLSPADWLQCAAMDLPDPEVDLSDPRIVRVMAMNPLVGKLFGDKGLSQITVPTIMLIGTQDGVTPPLSQQLRPFHQLAGLKSLVVVVGGTHLSVGDPNNVNRALTQIPFMPELRGEDTVALRRFLKAMSLSFAMQLTPEANSYEPFLDAAYAQQFSTDGLPLRLTHTLPENVLSWLHLTQQSFTPAKTSWTTLTSWLHLETLDAQSRFYQVERQFSAYLRLEQVSITLLQWPMQSLLF